MSTQTDSKKRTSSTDDTECTQRGAGAAEVRPEVFQLIKRIKTDASFVKHHYAECQELKTELDTQLEKRTIEIKQEKRECENRIYYYESIGAAVERSYKSKNWKVLDPEYDSKYKPDMCMGGDCWYDGNLDRTEDLSAYFHLPGYDYIICDVCYQNNEDEHFERWLRKQVGKDMKETYTMDEFDVAQYETETESERLERAKDDAEWDDDAVMTCPNHLFVKQATRRLIGTTICLCDDCFSDSTKRNM